MKYISRYLGRPVIATSRIDAYNGTSVTFHYQRHEDHETVTECIPAIDFIKRLIVHIPDRHFKMVRCYGIWIAPYALFFLYRQIVQSKPKTKNYIGNVMAKLHLHLFAMPFFISSLLYTILADLRSFLKRNK
ncbi:MULTISPECIES: transposase [Clostridia]|uniref:transposase n=1 Tax=Enterocloster clostridioformis TaxID=1531 RepID=UPI002FE6D743